MLEIESDVIGSMGAARGDAVAKFMSCREFMLAFTEWTIWTYPLGNQCDLMMIIFDHLSF